jgi:hypothetical protein
MGPRAAWFRFSYTKIHKIIRCEGVLPHFLTRFGFVLLFASSNHLHRGKHMRLVIVALIFLASLSAPASAEPEYMEVQRCIWRCMSHTGGKQPAYNRCIARDCDAKPRKSKKRKK